MPLLEEMLRIEAYFKRLKEEEDIAYEALHLATRQINALLDDSIDVTPSVLEEILHIFNTTTEQTQASGTGWYDVRLHLVGLIRANGGKYTDEGRYLRLLNS